MPTTNINVTLPDSLKAFIDQRIADRGYESHSEYVRDLVRRDEYEAAKDHLRQLIADGLASPVGKPWIALRDELQQRVKTFTKA
jgi:antitoxin ParD1/3/4